MSTRNAKIPNQRTALFDPIDKMQSSTLKRHPKMDLGKNDLLKLLSYLEGELQARDIVIAALRAEKAKQLLYQAKYGRFGLGDPFSALQRDSDNLKDSKFDEPAIKAMYDNQLTQLENLIATQRKAQMKMREQYQGIEKRYHKAVSELDDEKRKHAQDTAQGDDVTYMLEKERERLRQEVEFEKSSNKKLEKDLKKTLASLEEERGKSEKHKQIALLLIKERKLLGKPVKDTAGSLQSNGPASESKDDSPMNSSTESLKSLPPHVEAMLEEKLSEFDIEKQQLTSKLGREETRNATLTAQVISLNNEVENLRRQLMNVKLSPDSRSLSPVRVVHPANKGTCETDEMIVGGVMQTSPRLIRRVADSSEERGVPVGAPSVKATVDLSDNNAAKLAKVLSSKIVIPIAGRQSGGVEDGGGAPAAVVSSPNTPRRVLPVTRGVPPPVPPNKPILAASSPRVSVHPRPLPPPKNSLNARERFMNSVSDQANSAKSVPIPVNVISPGQKSPRSPQSASPRDTSKSTKWHGVDVVSCVPVYCDDPPRQDTIPTDDPSQNTISLHKAISQGEGDPHVVGSNPLVHSHSNTTKTSLPDHDDSVKVATLSHSPTHILSMNKQYKTPITIKQHGNDISSLVSPANPVSTICKVCLRISHSATEQSLPFSGVYVIATISLNLSTFSLDSSTISLNAPTSSSTLTSPTASTTPDPSNISPDYSISLDSPSVCLDSPAISSTTSSLVSDAVSQHFTKLNTGLRTKKTMRFEADEALLESPSLGLHINCLHECILGDHHSMSTSSASLDLLSRCDGEKTITVTLKPSAIVERFSLSTLVPMSQAEDYIRLIEQYKNVVFYGAKGLSKSFLVSHLANAIVEKWSGMDLSLKLITETCHGAWSHSDLRSLLVDHGCLVSTDEHESSNQRRGVIIVLDEIDKLDVPEVFGELLHYIDHRGSSRSFMLKGEDTSRYFIEHFFLIATMDRNRLSSIELSTQQRFRWVHLRVSAEPLRSLVARHLMRLMLHAYHGLTPPSNHPLFKAVEWLICVWHRLNDGLAKLGLPELIFGPSLFISCPIIKDDSKAIMSWFCSVWNGTIAPAVMEAVVHGSGVETPGEGQKKVANTAVYVLMQRAVVSGCPLHGAEKERYLKQFHGGNELQLSMRPVYTSNDSVSDIIPAPLGGAPSDAAPLLTPAADSSTSHIRTSSPLTRTDTTQKTDDSPSDSLSRLDNTPRTHKSHLPQGKSDNSLPKIPKLDIRSILTPRKSNTKTQSKPRNPSALSTHDTNYDKPSSKQKTKAVDNVSKSPVFSPSFTKKSPKTLNTFANFPKYFSLPSSQSNKLIYISEPKAMGEIPRTIPSTPSSSTPDSHHYIIDMDDQNGAISLKTSQSDNSINTWHKPGHEVPLRLIPNETQHRRAKSDSSSTYFAVTAYKTNDNINETDSHGGFLEESSC